MRETKPSSPRARFRTRAFASFGLLFSFLVTAFSGIVLFFRPEGTLASWTGWIVLGLDKKGWEGVHTLFMVLLIAFTAIHIVLNRKALWGYLKNGISSRRGAKLEFAAALGVCLLLLAASAGRWRPFWGLVDVRGSIKDGLLSVRVPPPVSEAEILSLADLCALVPVPVEEALAALQKAGFPADGSGETLDALSRRLGTSPERLYRIITGRWPAP